MSQSGLAVLASIKEGEEENFRSIITALNDSTPPQVDFEATQRTYFARFVILDDPDKGENRKRLLFAAIFDGDRKSYLDSLIHHTKNMDDFWGFCEAYQSVDNFHDFIDKHNHEANTFLKAYKDETVVTLREKLELQDDLNEKFDVPPSQYKQVIEQLPQHPEGQVYRKQMLDFFRGVFRNIPVKLIELLKLLAVTRYGVNFFYAIYAVVIRGINTPPILQTYSEAPAKKGGDCRNFGEKDGIKDEVVDRGYDSMLAFLKREVVQNQMTVVTINDPETVNRHKAIMNFIQAGADLLNSGTRIPTIHFGRWIMIDNDRRLLFLSNYDGSWETYIGDFVERANVPVDAFWSGSIGWRKAGCRDIDFFKEGIRCHQTNASYYYSANPQATVTNINNAIKIKAGYDNNIDTKTAKEWLRLL